jgi:type I restriction enzyme S subunit
MTLETFFEKFELFADAPDAVAKVRELVLDWAVTGKLCHTDSAEWSEGVLGDVIELISGQHLLGHEHNAEGRGIPYLTGPSDFGEKSPIPTRWTEQPKVTAKPGDILITVKGSGVGKTNVLVDQPTAISRQLMAIRVTGAEPEFVHLVLKRAAEHFQNTKIGIAIPGIGRREVLSLNVVLPSLAEQKRIVAKVDELMALCDRLEAQQQEREAKHTTLARASLARFADAPTPANLNLLFHKSYSIPPADLRKSILTLAVQGKLVPQDPNDELSYSIPEITPASPPLDVPDSWRWTEFGEIGEISGGFAFKSGDYTPSGVFILRVTNIAPSGVISKDEAVFLPPEKVTREIERFYLNEGDILLVMVGGSLGKIGLVTSDILPALLNQNLWRITPVNDEVDSQFLRLITDFAVSFQRQITHSTHGHLSREEFRKKSVAIPPACRTTPDRGEGGATDGFG